MNPENPFPQNIERVAHETSVRRTNAMIADGWLLLAVANVRSEDDAYVVHVLGRRPPVTTNTELGNEFDQRQG